MVLEAAQTVVCGATVKQMSPSSGKMRERKSFSRPTLS
jgi:hypothetical protein